MNVYTVGKATQGLANYLKNTGKSDLKVAVAYDSRIKSDVFRKSTPLLSLPQTALQQTSTQSLCPHLCFLGL